MQAHKEEQDQMAKSVFYSFHYKRDNWRVQQVMQMGALEEEPLLTPQQWEAVKSQGDNAIRQWIDRQMAGKSAVVVLIGAETASSRWVRYEIAHAWDNKKPLVGIYIHGLKDRLGVTDRKGADPFARVTLQGGGTVADHVPTYMPNSLNSKGVYGDIQDNLKDWVDSAYKR